MRRIHRRFVSWRIGGFGDLGEAMGGGLVNQGRIGAALKDFPSYIKPNFI